jgi:hypothetical protein
VEQYRIMMVHFRRLYIKKSNLDNNLSGVTVIMYSSDNRADYASFNMTVQINLPPQLGAKLLNPTEHAARDMSGQVINPSFCVVQTSANSDIGFDCVTVFNDPKLRPYIRILNVDKHHYLADKFSIAQYNEGLLLTHLFERPVYAFTLTEIFNILEHGAPCGFMTVGSMNNEVRNLRETEDYFQVEQIRDGWRIDYEPLPSSIILNTPRRSQRLPPNTNTSGSGSSRRK